MTPSVRRRSTHVAEVPLTDAQQIDTVGAEREQFAAAVARVEAEHASAVTALLRERRLRKELADFIERTDVTGRVGPRATHEIQSLDRRHTPLGAVRGIRSLTGKNTAHTNSRRVSLCAVS